LEPTSYITSAPRSNVPVPSTPHTSKRTNPNSLPQTRSITTRNLIASPRYWQPLMALNTATRIQPPWRRWSGLWQRFAFMVFSCGSLVTLDCRCNPSVRHRLSSWDPCLPDLHQGQTECRKFLRVASLLDVVIS